MIGQLLFGVTFLIYIAMGMFSLRSNPGGDQFGSAYSAFVLLVAYGICSLLLTIYILVTGGFNWISGNPYLRNAIVTIFWLGMMAAALYSVGRTELHKYYQLTGFVRSLSIVLSYSAIWLPLLMLLPYYYFLKPQWQETAPPILFKTPLVLGCTLGFLLFLTHKKMPVLLSKSFKKFDERELAFNHAMDNINKYQDVGSLLYYTGHGYDEQIRSAALTKIKASKNLEDDLIDILEHGTPYLVYQFLEENKVGQPERFVEPIVKSFAKLNADMQEGIVNPYKGGAIDIGPLLRVLEGQFKGSIAVFKPHILTLQEVMETPPAKSRAYDDPKACNEVLYKYREDVKNWLARH